MFAANDSTIKTYGLKRLELNLGLRRTFTWHFIVADIRSPIIGNDFLANHNLLVDLKNKQLIDGTTNIRTGNLHSVHHPQVSIKMLESDQSFANIVLEFPEILEQRKINSPILTDVTHFIVTNGPPVFSRPRRLDPVRFEAAKREIDELIQAGICQPSKSNWSSPAHLAKKPGTNKWRLCGDYRALNKITLPDRYPVPFLQDFTSSMHGKKIFSKIDLVKAYYQVPIEPSDIPKTAIALPFGLFEFKFMTFGLCNAAQTFQRLMHKVCYGLDFVSCYIDDVLIHSENAEQHKQHLRIFFQRLKEFGLTINTDKSEFGKSTIIFLGHEVTSDGIKPLPDKVQAIQQFEKPALAKDLKRFLAMINFYRRFIPHAVNHQMILQSLIVGNIKNDKTSIKWTSEAESAFEKCKEDLSNATLLAFPSKDSELSLVVDASDTSVGCVLHQIINGEPQPLGFYSKKLSNAQAKYSTYDRELTAIYQGVKYFRPMIEGRSVHILTDHKALIHSFKSNNASPRQIRQLDFISQFTTDIRHISGMDNICADFLSRINSVETSIDYEKIASSQENDEELQQLLEGKLDSSLVFKQLVIPGSTKPIYCDVSTKNVRPYIPKQFRNEVLTKIHGISHPGVKGTTNQMRTRFVWFGINKDCAQFAKHCLQCQQSKITRHVKAPLSDFQQPEDRFQHIHIDIIGELPTSNGFKYCLTIVDRFTRWPEAIPMHSITAESVARKIRDIWVPRFGVPTRITTDQGRQFESILFRELNSLLGVNHLRTSAYHPQANGMVERWHRTLKAAIMARAISSNKWATELPIILLGLRTTYKEDIKSSPAEMVYGKTLRIPGQFFGVNEPSIVYETDFVKQLSKVMNDLQPVAAAHHGKQNVFIFKSLNDCSHVFLRNDTVRSSLQFPYDGPYEVIERNDKFFKIRIRQREVNVSIDRLKPAYFPVDLQSVELSNILISSLGLLKQNNDSLIGEPLWYFKTGELDDASLSEIQQSTQNSIKRGVTFIT